LADSKTARNLKINSYMYLTVVFGIIYVDVLITFIKNYVEKNYEIKNEILEIKENLSSQ
jgi:hypothetical protein